MSKLTIPLTALLLMTGCAAAEPCWEERDANEECHAFNEMADKYGGKKWNCNLASGTYLFNPCALN